MFVIKVYCSSISLRWVSLSSPPETIPRRWLAIKWKKLSFFSSQIYIIIVEASAFLQKTFPLQTFSIKFSVELFILTIIESTWIINWNFKILNLGEKEKIFRRALHENFFCHRVSAKTLLNLWHKKDCSKKFTYNLFKSFHSFTSCCINRQHFLQVEHVW